MLRGGIPLRGSPVIPAAHGTKKGLSPPPLVGRYFLDVTIIIREDLVVVITDKVEGLNEPAARGVFPQPTARVAEAVDVVTELLLEGG